MTTELEDDFRDWLRAIPVSDEQLRQLRNLELPARRRHPLLSYWAPAAAALVLLLGAFVALSRAPSVGPTVKADGPVPIQTRAHSNDVCEAARVSGTLVADATYGLALDRSGRTSGAIWPFGYSARRVSGSVVLIGPSGTIVAHEGDQIVAAGAAGPDGTVEVECDIQVNGVRVAPVPTMTALPTPTPGCVRQGITALHGVVEALPDGWSDQAEITAVPAFPNTSGEVYGPVGVAVPPDEGPGRLALYETFPANDAYLKSRIDQSRTRGGTSIAVTVCGEATEVWRDASRGELVLGWTDRDKRDVLVGNSADMSIQQLVDSAESVYDCCG
jgi:hypothetical protein